MKGSFRRQVEQLEKARRALMLPHPNGEAASISGAYLEVSLGLKDLDRSTLDEHALAMVERLERLMSTTGIDDPTNRGTVTIRSEQLTLDERAQFAEAVDELAWWFRNRASL